MVHAVMVAASVYHLQFEHTVRVTPESATLKQGDPLLVRIDVRFGLLRPSRYTYGHHGLTPLTKGLLVSVRRPGDREFELVRTPDYDILNREIGSTRVPEPYGKTDAAFVWVVADRGSAVFDVPGEFLVRARVLLKDTNGVVYEAFSPPASVRVGPQVAAVADAADEVCPVLYRGLSTSGCSVPAPGADALRAALPRLDDSGAASAARRLLALHALRTAPPGEPRRLALAECDRVRAALPPVGQGEFDLNLADVLFDMGERELGLAPLRRAPPGPRRLGISLR